MAQNDKPHVKVRADEARLRISGKGLCFLEFTGKDGKATLSGPKSEVLEVLHDAIDLVEEDSALRVDRVH